MYMVGARACTLTSQLGRMLVWIPLIGSPRFTLLSIFAITPTPLYLITCYGRFLDDEQVREQKFCISKDSWQIEAAPVSNIQLIKSCIFLKSCAFICHCSTESLRTLSFDHLQSKMNTAIITIPLIVLLSSTISAKAADPACLQKPDPGLCLAIFPKWHYDKAESVSSNIFHICTIRAKSFW